MTTTKTAVGLRSERGPILLAVMISMGLIAIDTTIIATAVPAIVRDVGGFSQFPWLFSIFLLAQAVSVPIYGKLADMVGRKPVMLIGIAVFVLGSLLCGAAWSMPVLIASRAIQGLGAGAVAPMAMTIVGDLYSVEERARVQGYLGSVWGIASIVGPTLGGVFSDYASWRWIFFVNLPIGAIAAAMLWRRFEERVERRQHRIDFTGAALLAAGFSLLILALLEGGSRWGWTSGITLTVIAVGVALLIAFGFAERRAAEPVLPPWVFTRRVLVGGNLGSLLVGALLIGLTSYVPTYAQGVLSTSALVAGLAVGAMSMGWPLSSAFAGRVYMRVGFRNTAFIGCLSVLLGTSLMLTLDGDSSIWSVAAFCFIIGAGLGFVASPTLVAVQSVVGWERRGVVTGANVFARSVGSAVGVAAFGAIANATIGRRLDDAPASANGELPETADDVLNSLDSGASDAVKAFVRDSLELASHHVFVGIVGVAVLLAVSIALIPRRVDAP
ncbi:MDR family MFS transporter [Solicola gregarius]|uniref:MFS transporter n=1 Tax=Solicola gregarius TaxID=2908642 RepID=A0AA46YJ48_9ACTN|nr:MDR family MFS transporter [Solicola gregarius]UYM03867.1 MFS transporter [Solicola gregarius]